MTGRLPRVPFVQRCFLEFDDGTSTSAFLVNINVAGAYLAGAEQPVLGQSLRCRFRIPGNEVEIEITGMVAWLNPRQQHPVHSLPPGFGIRFDEPAEGDRVRIESLVRGYVRRHPRHL